MELQNRRQHTKETSPPHLPQEIIEEILVRLPVKSLLRLSCVSKPWRAIISSDSFIKAHLKKSSNNKCFEHHLIILDNSIVQANQCFLSSFSHEPLATAVRSDYPTCGSNDGPSGIIGSCNGVVCFFYFENKRNDLILWNPSTRKSKQLPRIIDDSERDYCMLWTAGFGFDESNDDYKVFIKLINIPCGVERTELVKTYSLKADTWKKVGVFAFDSGSEGAGVYVSGKLHWNRLGSDGLVREIVSFDLENEIFGTVEWPNGVERCFLGHDMIDGCLCCISPNDSKPDDHADYWLLKEYGVNDSWHRFATLERPSRVTGDGKYHKYFVPFFVGANGDTLCWNGESDTYTILFKKEDGFLVSPVDDLYPQYPPVIYFESLVGLSELRNN